MKNRLVLVDALACIYRAFYGIKQLSTKEGMPTNAVYGFARLIQQVQKKWEPGFLFVAYDGGLPKERLAIHADYKAQRPPMPEPLRGQLPLTEEFLAASGIPWLRKEGAEADDVIATLARRLYNSVDEIFIVTSDKDAFQMIDAKIKLINPSGGEEVWDADWVYNKTGVRPSEIVDWLTMVGDSSDNIPGVPGVGVKTAASLIASYKTIEGIFEHLAEIPSQKVKSALEASKDIIARNRKLITLNFDVDIPSGLDGLKQGNPDIGRLMALYERLEFKSMLEKLRNTEFLFN